MLNQESIQLTPVEAAQKAVHAAEARLPELRHAHYAARERARSLIDVDRGAADRANAEAGKLALDVQFAESHLLECKDRLRLAQNNLNQVRNKVADLRSTIAMRARLRDEAQARVDAEQRFLSEAEKHLQEAEAQLQAIEPLSPQEVSKPTPEPRTAPPQPFHPTRMLYDPYAKTGEPTYRYWNAAGQETDKNGSVLGAAE